MTHEHLRLIPQEEDHVASRPIAWIGIIGVVITLAGIAVSGWVIASEEKELAATVGRVPKAVDYAPEQVGIIEQTTILSARRGQRMMEEQRRQLTEFEWVDKKRGVVAIPIDRAIDLMVAREEAR